MKLTNYMNSKNSVKVRADRKSIRCSSARSKKSTNHVLRTDRIS